MNARTIEHQITEYMQKNSGLDQHRNYLGISKIGDCPRKAYREYLDGHPDMTEEAYRMCYTGYEQEAQILHMLAGMGLARILHPAEKEVVAPFDNRLRGHVDAETQDGDLLEVKSVSFRKFQKISEAQRAISKHYIQVQLYMLYGRWTRAFIVYRCRETYEHIVLDIEINPARALTYSQKAARILQAIDQKIEPECECGRCQGNEEGRTFGSAE